MVCPLDLLLKFLLLIDNNVWNTQKPTCIHILEPAGEKFPSCLSNLYFHYMFEAKYLKVFFYDLVLVTHFFHSSQVV